jgi:outer membrane lipoprotein-sorting protein
MGSLALTLSLTAYAAPQPVSVDELKSTLHLYQSISQLDVDFHQTKTLKDLGIQLQSSGTLKVSPPDTVLWRVLKPSPVTVTLNHGTVVIQTASGTQKFSQDENPSEKDRQNFNNMLSWLKLDADAISKQYEVTKLDATHLQFSAKQKEGNSIQRIHLQLTPSGNIANLKMDEASGDTIDIRFGTPKIQRRKD